jgi:hypothetical protein
VPKWVKLILALLLLPACCGAAAALWMVLRASGKADAVWIGILAGAACWIVIYLILPKPMWVYVVGHELTHAVWTWLMGGKVKRFNASSKGGHVVVTKSNFLIALAPYFFPLYAVLLVLVFAAAGLVWKTQPYIPWFHLLLGAAYAFHITLTLHVLRHSQSDITSQGYLFSATVIFLGNVVVLLLGVPMVTKQVSIPQAFLWWWVATIDLLRELFGWVVR